MSRLPQPEASSVLWAAACLVLMVTAVVADTGLNHYAVVPRDANRRLASRPPVGLKASSLKGDWQLVDVMVWFDVTVGGEGEAFPTTITDRP